MLALLAAVGGFLYLTHIGCPIKWMTGMSCPACGMTRAWIAALHLDLHQASTFHPLFFLAPAIVLLMIRSEIQQSSIEQWPLAIVTLLFVGCWMWRLYMKDPVVVFCEPGWMSLIRTLSIG